jgi:hypothetical protein
MSAPRVSLDFASRRRPLTLASGLLLALGAGAVTATYLEYSSIEAHRAGLETRLQALSRRSQRDPAQEMRAAALSAEAGRVADELSTPWTSLLAELEGASRDSGEQIALLSVEPDHAKHHVRITGESRDLPRVLGYVQRLQRSTLLRYPMLESHDVKTDDPQHPVRFAMTAEWKELP